MKKNLEVENQCILSVGVIKWQNQFDDDGKWNSAKLDDDSGLASGAVMAVALLLQVFLPSTLVKEQK